MSKLLLTSFWTSPEQDASLSRMIGKPIAKIKVAYIDNAIDIYNDEASHVEGRKVLVDKGYDMEAIDLRDYINNSEGLRQKLASKDVFWLAGGNPFYLRWRMKQSGADKIIPDLVKQGKVYVGASAAAVVSGPTLRHFDNQDDPAAAEEVIWDGLNLTDIVLVPHVDNADFGAGCREAGLACKKDGYKTQEITDAQAFLINGDEQRVI